MSFRSKLASFFKKLIVVLVVEVVSTLVTAALACFL